MVHGSWLLNKETEINCELWIDVTRYSLLVTSFSVGSTNLD
jgi:hypothetical protein